MSNEERWEFLLLSTKAVLRALRTGHNPTFEQLDKLETAVECIDGLKICGHRHIEDCECLKYTKRRGIVPKESAREDLRLAIDICKLPDTDGHDITWYQSRVSDFKEPVSRWLAAFRNGPCE